ncbi:hypothetical protein FD724_06875 [Nostoc sp. C057]|uniref:hypothetical protein n=1 Tax=Nostoc sp. C057 TaxID=2576903 RepID=UPI0015C3BE4F|nr:hypothetical protein [Nostoc sp. C057]QLE47861.1 hypothetical protein FD724_06875 [Nostoc sp. C057]
MRRSKYQSMCFSILPPAQLFTQVMVSHRRVSSRSTPPRCHPQQHISSGKNASLWRYPSKLLIHVCCFNQRTIARQSQWMPTVSI